MIAVVVYNTVNFAYSGHPGDRHLGLVGISRYLVLKIATRADWVVYEHFKELGVHSFLAGTDRNSMAGTRILFYLKRAQRFVTIHV